MADAIAFANRELSFLEFTQRIVDETADAEVPLLERLKFVSITGSNLDEFFMIRVAGLEQQLKRGILDSGPDGLTPSEQLDRILRRVRALVDDVETVLLEDLLPSLGREGIRFHRVQELDPGQRRHAAEVFDRQIFGMLTPLAVDPGHPFPLLRNRSLNLAVHLLPPDAPDESIPLLALVQVPALVPRFVEVPGPGALHVVLVEDLIRHHAGALFPGMRLLECFPFRVLRNWDLAFDEDEQEDLVDTLQKELNRRWRLDPVRLEVAGGASEVLVGRLTESLRLQQRHVQRHRGPLALCDLVEVLDRVGRSDLRDPPFQGVTPPAFQEQGAFGRIAERDLLLHHPYESYAPVLDFLDEAADDPDVLAIKQTLYRVNRDSPLLRSLIRAAENGKQVTALVELKARFDEETNMEWARRLEEAGVHVVYGLLGLKTHCKLALVVRREPDGIRRYVHLGTGNYNEKTAAIYSDLSLFSARPDVGEDVAAFFNLLTGYAAPPTWKKLTVAPLGMRSDLLDRIGRAARAAEAGQKARLTLKTNALVDEAVSRALAAASQSGVKVVLLVRGPCTLKVGIPGQTEGIVVRNVVDRFLEHSRIIHVHIDGRDEVLITSTDIMHRNFDHRVEVMLPVEDPALQRRIIDEILGLELKDDAKAAQLQPDGRFVRVPRQVGFRVQAELMRRARLAAAPRTARVQALVS